VSEGCNWTEDEDGNWWTECGEGFTFSDGTPIENRMRYCCYCGQPLVEQKYVEPEDDDE
jgi:hypothetical protein